MSVFATARRNMVDSQLRPNRVTDPLLLDAMEFLPREAFVPKAKQGIAYVDEDLEVAPGRYLLEPVVLARMAQALELSDTDTVLNIGCATGYDAALLGRLTASVVAVESDASLATQASETISALAVDNVAVVEGALTDGYAKQAPYDAVFFSGAIAEVPEAVARQLSPAGRLVAVVAAAEEGGVGRATLFLPSTGGLSARPLFDAGTPLLPGFAREPGFAF